MLPRLEKAARGLNGKERVVLLLKARNAGREPEFDPHRDFPNDSERRLYDRYVGVVYIANSELGMLLEVIKRQAEWLAEGRQTFEILRDAAEELATQEGQPLDWRRLPKPGRRRVSVPVYVAQVSEHVREAAAEAVTFRWQELRALERVWDEMGADFDGEDPVNPVLREDAASARKTLEDLACRYAIKRLPEPAQDFIDRTWELVDRAYDALKLVKEEP
jgi:hypothetical protein